MKFLIWIENRLNRLYNRIFDSAGCSIENLSVLRIFICLYLLLMNERTFAWLGEVPAELFDPPRLSIAALFRTFPSRFTFEILESSAAAALIGILIGVKAGLCGVIYVLLNIFMLSFFYSMGKIDHSMILPLCTILILSFSGWGSKYALLKDKAPGAGCQKRCAGLVAILLCFGMLTAGLPKVVAWIDFDLSTGGFMNWFYTSYFEMKRDNLLAPLILKLPAQFFETFDYIAAIFEVSGFVCLLSGRRIWKFWLLFACVFHVMNILFLNIHFTDHIMVYGVFLFNFDLLFGKRIRIGPSVFFLRALTAALCAFIVFKIFIYPSLIESHSNDPYNLFAFQSLMLYAFTFTMGWITLRNEEDNIKRTG